MQRRTEPRAAVDVECTLARRTGSPIPCRTVDLCGGGMRVSSSRPLSVDETVEFAMDVDGSHFEGQARVLRMQGWNEYALRFEELRADMAAALASVLRPFATRP